MSRSGYTGDCENLALWRGAVSSAINGKRGQTFLRDLVESLDAMPEKRLITSALVTERGCCAMGAVAVRREIDTSKVDPFEREDVARLFGIAPAMAAEIAFENDEADFYTGTSETPEQRWVRMRAWAAAGIINIGDDTAPSYVPLDPPESAPQHHPEDTKHE